MHIYTYIHVSAHTCMHTYTHTYNMYICTHANTSETTMRQRMCRKPDLTSQPPPISLSAAESPWPFVASSCLFPRKTEKRRKPQPTAAHDTITTTRHPDYNCSSALVRSRSTQFMALPSCEPQRQHPNWNEVAFLPFWRVCTHIYIHICPNLVHLNSSGPPGVSSRPLGSHPSTLYVQCSCVCGYTHTYTHIHYGPFELLQILVDQSQLEKSTVQPIGVQAPIHQSPNKPFGSYWHWLLSNVFSFLSWVVNTQLNHWTKWVVSQTIHLGLQKLFWTVVSLV